MNAQLHAFPGGLRLEGWKQLSNASPIAPAPIPRSLIYPLQQHIGRPAVPVVTVGQHVLKGQLIARSDSYVSSAIHAATSGVVTGIESRPVAHPAGLSAPCIVIEADGTDEWGQRWPALDWTSCDREMLLERIAAAGVIGLGGAGFPAHVKVKEGIGNRVQTLIVNGVECEPYITCDDRLMCERGNEVIQGATILARAVQADRCVLALEEHAQEALGRLTGQGSGTVDIVAVPEIYPAGGEKQLIKVLTGIEVPSGLLPVTVGVLMHNAATAAAVYRAIANGEPMLSRIVTATGRLRSPANFEVRLGTPVATLLEAAGGCLDPAGAQVIMGGPMMGIRLTSDAVPITKTSNCVLVLDAAAQERPREFACIRCGACAEVCPVRLQPQQLFRLAKSADFDAIQRFCLFDCIECGCCSYVCPSRIPLIHYFRYAKSEIEALDEAADRAFSTRLRFEVKVDRLKNTDAAAAAAARNDTAQDALQDLRAYVSEAIARTRARRNAGGDSTPEDA
jgi:electron transport complex protein RnfC